MPVLMRLFVFSVFFVVMPLFVVVSAATARFVLLVPVGCPFMDSELHTFDSLPLLALEVHVEIPKLKLGEFPLEGGRFDAEVAKRTNGHVAADAGNTVKKENAHGSGWDC